MEALAKSQSKSTVSDRIAQALVDQIIRGDLAPDEKLRQDHIAKAFDASHVPVREALLRLQARGLAVSEPRRGVRVAPFDPAGLREVKEMRLALEPLALRHAVLSGLAADFSQAEAARIACDKAQGLIEWEQENRRFHYAILSPCRMPRLLAQIEDLQVLSARHLLATWSSAWEGRTDRDHRAIMRAIASKDVEAAVSLLTRHLQRL